MVLLNCNLLLYNDLLVKQVLLFNWHAFSGHATKLHWHHAHHWNLRNVRLNKLRCSYWLSSLSWCLDLLFMFVVVLLMLLLLLGCLLLLMVFNRFNLFNWLNNFGNMFNNFLSVLSFNDCSFSWTNCNFLSLDFSFVNDLALLLFFAGLAFLLLTLWLLGFTNWSCFDNFTYDFSVFYLRCCECCNSFLSCNSFFFSLFFSFLLSQLSFL